MVYSIVPPPPHSPIPSPPSHVSQDKSGSGKGKKLAPPPFSSDLFIRRVHLLVGETLEPVWRDARLPSLPQEAAARVLAAVLELMQSLQVLTSLSPYGAFDYVVPRVCVCLRVCVAACLLTVLE